MYKIERKDYGVKITFAGFIQKDEMLAYKKEFKLMLDLLPEKFGIFSDIREMKPMPADSQKIFNANPELVTPRLTRSATIVNSSVVKIQSKRLVKEWKVSDSKRYIDASITKDWEAKAIDWIKNGVEPE